MMRTGLMQACLLVVTLGLIGCDAGVGPDSRSELPLAFSIAASVNAGSAENDALGEAFDRVDNFRLIVRDVLTGEILADTVLNVTPGAASHTLDVRVPESARGRELSVLIIAFQGTTELFRTETQAMVTMGADGGTVEVPVRYTGPGLRGSVTDISGVGRSGVTMSLLSNSALVAEAVTASDGSFLFLDLTPGTYVVRPSSDGGLLACPGQRTVTVSSSTESFVAGFVLRSGACTVRVLVVSGGDIDDTGSAAAELAGDPNIEVETFFVASVLPGLQLLREHDVVLLYANGLFGESKALGDQLSEFVTLGGNVVFGSFYWQARTGGGKAGSGWGALEDRDPFSSAGGSVYSSGSLGSVSTHPLTAGLASLTSSGFRGGVATKGGTTVVASWDDGVPLLGFRTLSVGQRMVGVSLFPAHSSVGGVGGDTGRLWKNAVLFAGAAGGPARAGVVPGGN